jgi:hypothetical protein
MFSSGRRGQKTAFRQRRITPWPREVSDFTGFFSLAAAGTGIA